MAASARRPLPEEEKCPDEAKAAAKAVQLLAARELCSSQLYARLCRYFTQRAAAAAVADMVQRGYVDDKRFAAVYARTLLAARKSRRAAAEAMRSRGLDDEIAAAAIAAAYAEAEDGQSPEQTMAAELIERHYRAKIAAGRGDLVMAALLRRGFGRSTALHAVKTAEAQLAAAQAEF